MVEYPYLVCDAHPGVIEPGYLVCRHVLEGEAPTHVVDAGPQNMGEVSCEACVPHLQERDYVLANFRVACASSCKESGWVD